MEKGALEEPVQALATGIDDAGLAQDREERRGPGDRLLGGLHRGGQHRLDVLVALGRGHGAIGRLADDRQDGAFDRLGDGPVGGLGSLRQRVGQVEPVEAALAGERFRHPSEDLAGDDPGVAAGTHEGAEADGRRDAVGGLPGDGIGFLECRLDGRDHVRAGVAVGDREHVEAVDLVGVGLEVGDRRPGRPPAARSRRRNGGPSAEIHQATSVPLSARSPTCTAVSSTTGGAGRAEGW